MKRRKPESSLAPESAVRSPSRPIWPDAALTFVLATGLPHWAAFTLSAPTATRAGALTTSCGGAPDGRATPGLRSSSSPRRTISWSATAAPMCAKSRVRSVLICRTIVASKLGMVLVSIRDAEARTPFLGYRVESYKLFVFTLSACMAGVAGALYVPQVGIINPSEFAPGNSIEAVIWVAVGGRGTLVGAVIGAIAVNYAKTTFTSGPLAPYWLFVLGSLFVLVTLLLPRGIVGTVRYYSGRWREHRDVANARAAQAAPKLAE